MSMNPLLKKLYLENTEFVTSETLKKYCKELEIDYNNTIKNLLYLKNMVRIFKGIFYVKNLEELKFGRWKYSFRELIAKGLEMKGVKNWYFGLYSALKINNMTHESFVIEHILNDKIFRSNPIKIAGYNVKFHTVSSKLFDFGINKKGFLKVSDPEKTILDFMYIWKYNGVSEKIIIMDLADYAKNVSKEKLTDYSNYYPNSVKKALEGLK